MSILFYCNWPNADEWLTLLRQAMPEETIESWPGITNIDAVEIALVWATPTGFLSKIPNLSLILSLGAGVDHIMADKDIPRDVPIARVVDPIMADRMAEYVAGQVLRHHLQLDRYRDQAGVKTWRRHFPRDAGKTTTTVLGLGSLGQRAAEYLSCLGFRSCGWSRNPKTIPGVDCYAGEGGLGEVLAKSQHLICLLPLTDDTIGILNKSLFDQLPQGAQIINCARGHHLQDDALFAALDSGQLSEAVLDVFVTEPLPQDHRFWTHPNIVVTPHISSLSEPTSSAQILAQQVADYRAGKTPENQISLDTGY
jgi:glyoxylate/hydroxypyruvate reductase A